MGFRRKPALIIGVLATLTVFLCSIPFMKSLPSVGSIQPIGVGFKSSKLSGILSLQPGCERGYYQVKLQGILDNSNIQVESQTDSSGRFNLVAPSGQYVMQVGKDNCGSKEPVELQENTEHMLSVNIGEIKTEDKTEAATSRIPASMLIK